MPQGKGISAGQYPGRGLPESSDDFKAATGPEPQDLPGSYLPRLPGTQG